MIAALLLVGEAPILAVIFAAAVIARLIYSPWQLAVMATSARKSVFARALKTNRGRRALVIPPVVAIGGYLAGLDVVTPTINANFPKDFSPFFATSAQVIAALLVALVVEQASFLGPTAPTTKVAGLWALLFVALGEVAALVGLSNRLDHQQYRQAFAVTVGAGLAALAAVVLTGWRKISASAYEHELGELKEAAAEGDPSAKAFLGRLGLTAHEASGPGQSSSSS